MDTIIKEGPGPCGKIQAFELPENVRVVINGKVYNKDFFDVFEDLFAFDGIDSSTAIAKAINSLRDIDYENLKKFQIDHDPDIYPILECLLRLIQVHEKLRYEFRNGIPC